MTEVVKAISQETKRTLYGDFLVSIEEFEVAADGNVVKVTWSVQSKANTRRQTFDLQWCDPLMQMCDYQRKKQELQQYRLAMLLLDTLDIDSDTTNRELVFCFMQDGFGLSDDIYWKEEDRAFA